MLLINCYGKQANICAHLRFGDVQQLGHVGALAGAQVFFYLKLLFKLENLTARERGARLFLASRHVLRRVLGRIVAATDAATATAAVGMCVNVGRRCWAFVIFAAVAALVARCGSMVG